MKTNPYNRRFAILLTLGSGAQASLGLTTMIHLAAPFRHLMLFGVWLCLAVATTNAADLGNATNRFEMLAKLKLEDVLNTEVTTVSKRPEKLFETAAAVSVISGDDIRRSGARSFAEALRLAPGTQVAQMDANKWAVTARGFNDLNADKLLVLIDGRTIYSPLFSGVFWDIQNYLLEDIEQIEVIRGPGGTLWGANAVNGVINIITKDAKETQGLYVTGGGGTEERGFFGARYGDRLGENGYLRSYIQGFDRENFSGGVDDSNFLQGGFRSDWHLAENRLTLQGDVFSAKSGMRVRYPGYETFAKFGSLPFVRDDFSSAGGNILFRFDHKASADSGQARIPICSFRPTMIGSIANCSAVTPRSTSSTRSSSIVFRFHGVRTSCMA